MESELRSAEGASTRETSRTGVTGKVKHKLPLVDTDVWWVLFALSGGDAGGSGGAEWIMAASLESIHFVIIRGGRRWHHTVTIGFLVRANGLRCWDGLYWAKCTG